MLILRLFMKVAYYIRKEYLLDDEEIRRQLIDIEDGGIELYRINETSGLQDNTECILSLGGDGTFLAASQIAIEYDIPLLGVNLGRLGFLAGSRLQDVSDILQGGLGETRMRTMLEVRKNGVAIPGTALNEVSFLRKGTGAIGLEVKVDDLVLPTYWADGLIVATSSGSTAYNLSVGGPICAPDSRVVVLSPIAPHNLGVRPLVLPEETKVAIRLVRGVAEMFMDDRRMEFRKGDEIVVAASGKRLKTICEKKDNFIDALRSRFFWGRDVRNEKN